MCCDVSHAEHKDISEVINLFNNVSWRIMANNKIVDADKNSWITKQKYNTSIVKVIAKAIAKAVADCITDKNEFANKNANDVITFNVTAKNYTKANWNAVVLWNYLHILKYDYLNNINCNQDEIFNELKTRLCDNYPSEGVSNLDGEIIDIKGYDEALSLKAEMELFNRVYKNTREATLETIIKNNTRITPIADWELVGANMPCKLQRDITKQKVNIEDIDSLLLWNVLTSYFKGIFTPIKIKMDNGLYFVDEDNIWGSLRAYDFGKASYKIDEISKDVTLHGKQWRSDDYKKYKLDDLDIINKIENKVSTLFDGLQLRRLSR